MKQEAADEFLRLEPHHALGGFMAVVFPAERDVSISDIDQAIVRNGDAMRVTSQVVEHLLRATERFLRVHHPFGASRVSQMTGECAYILQGSEDIEELQSPGVKRALQPFEEQTPEQAREHAHRQEEARAASNPARLVRCQIAMLTGCHPPRQARAARCVRRATAARGASVADGRLLQLGAAGLRGLRRQTIAVNLVPQAWRSLHVQSSSDDRQGRAS
jgi:hypothetical protein